MSGQMRERATEVNSQVRTLWPDGEDLPLSPSWALYGVPANLQLLIVSRSSGMQSVIWPRNIYN